MSPSSPTPANADHGRGELFRAYARGRTAVYAYVLGCGGAIVAGAWQQSPRLMLLGPLAVVAMVLGVAFFRADRLAENRFYDAFAGDLGLVHWRRFQLLTLTPLLGAGDKRWCEHWMAGALPGEPRYSGGIGQFVFQEEEREDGRTQVTDTRRFTICVIELEQSLPFFKGLYVRPRRGLFPEGKDWVSRSSSSTFELESSELTARYEIRIASDQSEVMARQLLSPTLVAWLAGHPLRPCFEVKAGTLVVYVPRVLEDAGNLGFLLDAARHIAGRVLLETQQALHRSALRA